jgi:N-acetylglucosamine-6-phosphate deacetylase
MLRLSGRALLEGGVERAVVLISDGEVTWCGPEADAPEGGEAGETVPTTGLLAPGFVDLHVHGAGGADAADGTTESLEVMCRAHARRGTVALCPTVLTSPPEVLLRALEVIRAATGTCPGSGARVLGAHLEGPFLNPGRAGAQPPEHLRAPDRGLCDELLAAAGGTLRVVTLAPELPGALELTELLAERGVVVSVGHSDATHAQVLAAVERGARLAAHTFNAMRPLHHREVGILGAVLLSQRLHAEVIADGVHVSGPALELLWRLKAGRLCLVTDCTAALDAPPGAARLGDRPVTVSEGAVRLPDGTLAGSSLTLDRAVRQLVTAAGVTPPEALRAASGVPAGLLGLERGRIAPGMPADLVVLDASLDLERVMIGGRWLSLEAS